MKIILFPCQFGNINQVDEDYQKEYNSAIKNGFEVLLFNFDDFTLTNSKLKLNKNLNLKEKVTILYRGWMLKFKDYERLYNSLLTLNMQLINNPIEYRNCHEFPYSYNNLKDYTPKCIYYKKDEKIDWGFVKKNFSKFLIKDFVKSVKGFDFPIYFDDNYSNEQLDEFVKKFIQIRDNMYTGGIVIKEFMELDKTNDITHEFRGFYLNKQLFILYQNSKNDNDFLPYQLAQQVPLLDSNFYTIDFAILKGDIQIVIETGDGQVSGISNENMIDMFYKNLSMCKEDI